MAEVHTSANALIGSGESMPQRKQGPCKWLNHDATKEQRLAEHRRKMFRKQTDRQRGYSTGTTRAVQDHIKKGGRDWLRMALGNFRRNIRREQPPRNSIWPEGKIARPGRMV